MKIYIFDRLIYNNGSELLSDCPKFWQDFINEYMGSKEYTIGSPEGLKAFVKIKDIHLSAHIESHELSLVFYDSEECLALMLR